ncbi:MAG: phosphatase PAP2 family protein [Actinobacteria bacterium]|nr:MAG: phosphatase PAP2 family protein [Actinomycetota bacterium]
MRARLTSAAGAVGRRARRWGFVPGASRQRSWIDLLLVPWLAWIFDAINDLAPVRQALAEGHGHQVLDFERSLHLASELSLNTWLASHHFLSQISVYWYENVHAAVTFVLIGWLWWRRPDLLAPLRNALIALNLIALAIFWSYPVAPPRMLAGGYVDLVQVVHHAAPWPLGATAAESNQLAAFPSLHIAWAVWSSVVLWRLSRRTWVRALALAYPLVTMFSVMATANHWLADGVLGAAITLVCLPLGSRLRLRRAVPVAAAVGAAPAPAPVGAEASGPGSASASR